VSTVSVRALAGALAFFECTLAVTAARADGPPPADVVNLTPHEPTPPPAAPTAPVELLPVELLPVAHPSKVAALIFGGAAIVGVGVGIGFGVAALDEKSTFRAHPTLSNAGLANQDSVVADVGFGAAVIAGVTSLVLFLKHEEPTPGPSDVLCSKPSALHLTVAPTFDSHGGGAGALLRF
jgi:hypothetical protein